MTSLCLVAHFNSWFTAILSPNSPKENYTIIVEWHSTTRGKQVMSSALALALKQPTIFHGHQYWFSRVTAAVPSNAYVVYMGDRGHDEVQHVENSHHELLSGIFGSEEAAAGSILYSYKHGFSGFAAVLTPSQAKIIADLPGVVRVIPNRIFHLHTTRSWDFLNVNQQMPDGILSKGQSGSGSIIGVIDSGVWPESESFKDDKMEDVPLRWKGICQDGDEFNRSHCNRKIIGARWYAKGYKAETGKLNTADVQEFLSARDAEGHGTHTASTAAGAWVENANFLQLGNGLARGGAPSAFLAIYKVCWAFGDGCSSVDILAAIDDAILDGVDVISMSIGSSPPFSTYIDDVIAIGSLHAVAKGITVVCAGGNDGPFPETIANAAPWVITVAASTIDRSFPVAITLGSNQTFMGQSLYTNEHLYKFQPVVYGGDIAAHNVDPYYARSCDRGSLNAALAKGNVILCFESRSQSYAVSAADSVKEVGGVGIIFSKYPTRDVDLCLDIPCAQVDLTTGTSILTYVHSTSNPVIKFGDPKTVVGMQVSPSVALFSSRGPNSLSPTVLKPDIAAPGVNILASWSAAGSAQPRSVTEKILSPLKFKLDSGTSMACPHVSGIVALLKAIHPKWSPAAIKSALATTASRTDEYGNHAVAEAYPNKQADPFDYGGGEVNPNKAIDPGLIFDMGETDHIQFLCAMGYNNTAISLVTRTDTRCSTTSNFLLNYNLPSITIPELKNNVTVSRVVTNVGPEESVYMVREIRAPSGTEVTVDPSVLLFNASVKTVEFNVAIRSRLNVDGSYRFGSLVWEDGGAHVVRIPLIVRSVI